MLAEKSINFEQKILNEVVGSQDQIAAAYGGFNKIIFKKSGRFIINSFSKKKKNLQILNKNLLLVYTGINRTAHQIAKSYIKKLNTSKKFYISEIKDFVNEGEKLLTKGHLDDFGRLLHESWKIKKSLSSSISNTSIDEIYNEFINKGALGGKLLGAGGGGFFLFYIPHHMQKKFINKSRKLITIPFNFTFEGSKIILNKDNRKIIL